MLVEKVKFFGFTIICVQKFAIWDTVSIDLVRN